jgi:hypothetical protein
MCKQTSKTILHSFSNQGSGKLGSTQIPFRIHSILGQFVHICYYSTHKNSTIAEATGRSP